MSGKLQEFEDNLVNSGSESEDLDELFEQLDNEEASAYESSRREELSNYFNIINRNKGRKDEGFGQIKVFENESELIRNLKNLKNTVILNFSINTFQNCIKMNSYLKELSSKNLLVQFFQIDPTLAPFFTKKLNIKVLPCLIIYGKNGVEIDKVIGFDGINDYNDFEKRLNKKGILERPF